MELVFKPGDNGQLQIHNPAEAIEKAQRDAGEILQNATIEAEAIVQRAKQDALAVAAAQLKTESAFRRQSEGRLRDLEAMGARLSEKEKYLKQREAELKGREEQARLLKIAAERRQALLDGLVGDALKFNLAHRRELEQCR